MRIVTKRYDFDDNVFHPLASIDLSILATTMTETPQMDGHLCHYT